MQFFRLRYLTSAPAGPLLSSAILVSRLPSVPLLPFCSDPREWLPREEDRIFIIVCYGDGELYALPGYEFIIYELSPRSTQAFEVAHGQVRGALPPSGQVTPVSFIGHIDRVGLIGFSCIIEKDESLIDALPLPACAAPRSA